MRQASVHHRHRQSAHSPRERRRWPHQHHRGHRHRGFRGDGGPAASALISLAYPAALRLMRRAISILRIATTSAPQDHAQHRIITTVAGTASRALRRRHRADCHQSQLPDQRAFDAAGNLIIADSGNNRIRRVGPSALRTLANVSAASFSATGSAAEEIAPPSARISLLRQRRRRPCPCPPHWQARP